MSWNPVELGTLDIARYATLNDAAALVPQLAAGDIKVWYTRPEASREFSWGDGKFDVNNPERTHVLLGSVKGLPGGEVLEELWCALQGEVWSPNGEARALVQQVGTGHTSMSVGDVIQMSEGFFMVKPLGFERV